MDPALVFGQLTGGTEMAAIYGELFIESPTGQFQPYLAQGIHSNADHTVWTLTLRPNTTFSDGEPFTSQVVVQNIDRFLNPAVHAYPAAQLANIKSMMTPDDRTVVFHLQEPYADFPEELSIYANFASPKYLQEVQSGDTTAVPIGAGPFKVSSFRPGDELTVVANDSFVLGRPYLDEIKFISIPSQVGTLQTMESGGIDIAQITDPQAVQQAKQANLPAQTFAFDLAQDLYLNTRPSSPLHDVRLRQAVAMAINVPLYSNRVYQETKPLSQNEALFPKGSPWYSPSLKAIPYDPTAAARLVAQVKKSTGWNGTLSFVAYNDPEYQRAGVALESMLRPIGISLNIEDTQPLNSYIGQVILKHDFDIAPSTLPVGESNPYYTINNFLGSSLANAGAYQSPGMTRVITDLRQAAAPAQIRSALNEFNAVWINTVPMVNLGSQEQLIVHNQRLHGFQTDYLNAIVILNTAWVS